MSGRHFRHVGDRQKCLSFEGCSRQTHLPTLPAKVLGRKKKQVTKKIDKIISAHDSLSLLINKIGGMCRNIQMQRRVVFRQTTVSRSNLTDCHTFLEKNQMDPIIGNRSILMHFWIDLIEPVYLPSWIFFIFLHFWKVMVQNVFCVFPLQALGGGTWLICLHVV